MKKQLFLFGIRMYERTDKIQQFQLKKLLFLFISKYLQLLLPVMPLKKFSIYHRLGIISLANKNLPKAKYYSKKMNDSASSEDEKSRVSLFKANILFENNEYQLALSEYLKLIQVSRFKTMIFSNIAFTYEKLGDFKNALLYAEKSIEVSQLEKDLGHTIDPSENVSSLIKKIKTL